MKTTPSQNAARRYLNDFLIMPIGVNGEATLLHKKHRLWIIKGQQDSMIVHICTPRKLLHYIEGRIATASVQRRPGSFVGKIVDGSHWHTQKISYKCFNCGKTFDGGVAFAIKLGLEDKEKFQ